MKKPTLGRLALLSALAFVVNAVVYSVYPLVALLWIGEYLQDRGEDANWSGVVAALIVTIWGALWGTALVWLLFSSGLSSGTSAAIIAYAMGLMAFFRMVHPRQREAFRGL